MFRMTKLRIMVVWAVIMVMAASAQTPRQREVLLVQGCPGQMNVRHLQGHAFVDIEDLARITNASVTREKDEITMTLPRCDASEPSSDPAAESKFSRPFMRAAIESMASIREWGGILMAIVQNGFPIGNTAGGNPISVLQGRAADSVALASTAASTQADYQGVALLQNEFNNIQSWSDRFVADRNSLSATNLSVAEHPLKNDQDAQKLIHCGQFLAQMFAGGTFQDDASCH
jgi:hypothetical protein